jgi:hypothetical protein
MSARTQHGWVAVAAVLLLVVACSDAPAVTRPATHAPSSSPDLAVPGVRLPGLHTSNATFDATPDSSAGSNER